MELLGYLEFLLLSPFRFVIFSKFSKIELFPPRACVVVAGIRGGLI